MPYFHAGSVAQFSEAREETDETRFRVFAGERPTYRERR
jgi:hypothetical protein